eukprot:g3289.t1
MHALDGLRGLHTTRFCYEKWHENGEKNGFGKFIPVYGHSSCTATGANAPAASAGATSFPTPRDDCYPAVKRLKTDDAKDGLQRGGAVGGKPAPVNGSRSIVDASSLVVTNGHGHGDRDANLVNGAAGGSKDAGNGVVPGAGMLAASRKPTSQQLFCPRNVTFFFDDNIDFEKGGAALTRGCANLRDPRSGEFVEFGSWSSVDFKTIFRRTKYRNFVARTETMENYAFTQKVDAIDPEYTFSTLRYHYDQLAPPGAADEEGGNGSSHLTVLVKVSILDAILDPFYFVRILTYFTEGLFLEDELVREGGAPPSLHGGRDSASEDGGSVGRHSSLGGAGGGESNSNVNAATAAGAASAKRPAMSPPAFPPPSHDMVMMIRSRSASRERQPSIEDAVCSVGALDEVDSPLMRPSFPVRPMCSALVDVPRVELPGHENDGTNGPKSDSNLRSRSISSSKSSRNGQTLGKQGAARQHLLHDQPKEPVKLQVFVDINKTMMVGDSSTGKSLDHVIRESILEVTTVENSHGSSCVSARKFLRRQVGKNNCGKQESIALLFPVEHMQRMRGGGHVASSSGADSDNSDHIADHVRNATGSLQQPELAAASSSSAASSASTISTTTSGRNVAAAPMSAGAAPSGMTLNLHNVPIPATAPSAGGTPCGMSSSARMSGKKAVPRLFFGSESLSEHVHRIEESVRKSPRCTASEVSTSENLEQELLDLENSFHSLVQHQQHGYPTSVGGTASATGSSAATHAKNGNASAPPPGAQHHANAPTPVNLSRALLHHGHSPAAGDVPARVSAGGFFASDSPNQAAIHAGEPALLPPGAPPSTAPFTVWFGESKELFGTKDFEEIVERYVNAQDASMMVDGWANLVHHCGNKHLLMLYTFGEDGPLVLQRTAEKVNCATSNKRVAWASPRDESGVLPMDVEEVENPDPLGLGFVSLLFTSVYK